MAKKRKTCPKCRRKLFNIESNYKACSNINCDYTSLDSEIGSIYFPYFMYEDSRTPDLYSIDTIENDYNEDYDSYLFFSNPPDYITRFEYRQNTNFIEDTLFENKRPAKFDRHLKDDEINKKDLEFKYDIINKGRQLESINSKEAFNYYKSKKYNFLFKNDYYIHRKLVKLSDDYTERLELIIDFFKSGIYCSRYNYLWFLKKLYETSRKIDVPQDIIDDCLHYFKTHGFKNKADEDNPFYLAEKITKSKGKLHVFTEKQYSFKQFKFELSEEASQLILQRNYGHVISIYKRLVFDYGFNSSKFYKGIISSYHRLRKYDEELKWLYLYFNNVSQKYFDNDYFEYKLNDLTHHYNEFSHESLFFDKNKYYLTEEDFNSNGDRNLIVENYLDLVRQKYLLVKKASQLERYPNKAVSFYTSLLENPLFENDYYIFKQLILLYEELDDFENVLSTIRSFFESGIYCDRLNYLFFADYLKKLFYIDLISYDEINYLLEFFKKNGFKNHNLEIASIPVAERLTFKKNRINIIPEEEFSNNQLIKSLNLEIYVYSQNSMLEHANAIYKILIDDYYDTPLKFYERICDNYRMMNDYENELKYINEFLDNVSNTHYDEKHYFSKRLKELDDVMAENPNPVIIKDPEIEIFFEKNDNFLSYEDFKNNLIKYSGLTDSLRIKYYIFNKGRKLENDYQKAIDFYKPLLNDCLFENDYYIYRRLVLVYSTFGEYELAYETIRDFFNSGIYCNRYQYLWFLHKLEVISKFKFISQDEITDMLKSFKIKGFKNKKSTVLTDRLVYNKSSIEVRSSDRFNNIQKEYEIKEEISQLRLNNQSEKAAKLLKQLIDMKDFVPSRNYMHLCHLYREIGDYNSEKELIYVYLLKYSHSEHWFKNRLKELEKIMK